MKEKAVRVIKNFQLYSISLVHMKRAMPGCVVTHVNGVPVEDIGFGIEGMEK